MTRWLRRAFLPVALALLLSAALLVPVPFFIWHPGTLLSLGGCVEVDAVQAEPVAGDYLLTSVSVSRGTFAGIAEALVDREAQVVPVQRIVAPGQTDREYFARQRQVFRQAAQRAAALALDAAGFPVDPEALTGEGALVVRVIPGTPAEGILQPGDVIDEVEGQPVRTAEDLQNLVDDARSLDIRFLRDGEQRTVAVTPQEMDIGGERRPVIGVQIQTYNERIELPVPVDVPSGRIGGPSAGLMIALTVYDKVSDVDLAAGRRIAGTGTINAEGRVGAISGIGLKALSAHRNDADVFIAPSRQVPAARALLPASTELHVLGVDTFDDAVGLLERTANRSAGGASAPPECSLRPAA